VLEICGGEASRPVSAGTMPAWRRDIALRLSRVSSLGGVDLPREESARILSALGFEIAPGADRLKAAVPSWRADVEGEADLVEEVLRIHGYERIPAVSLPRSSPIPEHATTPAQRRAVHARRLLAERGLMEAATFSFMRLDWAKLFGGGDPALTLANPISADLDQMRPSLLPNLLAAAGRNAARGFADLALFEVGPRYEGDRPEDQRLTAGGLRAGAMTPRHWAVASRPADVFDAKADALALLTALGTPVENLQTTTDAPAWFHPGRSGVLRLGPTVLAQFGELHPRVLRALDVKGPAAGFEVDLDRVAQPRSKPGTARPLLKASPFQPIERDFAFVVAGDTPAEKLVRAARSADKALIANVSVFDQFAGPAIGAGKKSIAIAVVLQPTDHTLSETEIEAVAAKIVAAVNKATGGVLRG
jgi:phenylalanyl-tRNA synthetase beta chain